MKLQNIIVGLLLVIIVAPFVLSCASARRVKSLVRETPGVTLALPNEKELRPDTLVMPKQDTLEIVDFDGRKVMLMNAIQDDDGEMVAHDYLQAAVVTARFRNIAERHGKVDLEFQVKVPRIMLEQDWQTRFYPDMYILEDSVRLDMLILTGDKYRKSQMLGYQRYNKFLATILDDTSGYVNLALLEKWLERNMPQVYQYKYIDTVVSEEEFSSCFGVTEKEAVAHYTNKNAVTRNNKKKSRSDAMYRKYIKAPIITEGVRLDSVFVNMDGDFVYNYVQTIETRPKLRKVDIVLSGEIYQQDMLLYTVPRCEPLTFYISSLSAFTDNTERYLTKVIERKAEANTAYHIEFEAGKSEIKEDLADNAVEMLRIKENILAVLQNEKFDLDSITIRSYASPEGSLALNRSLSVSRSKATADVFSSYMKHVEDSIRREAGYTVIVGDDMSSTTVDNYQKQDIRFRTSVGGENWTALDSLVRCDTVLTAAQMEKYFSYADEPDMDRREQLMKEDDSYKYIYNTLYPRLRTVSFDFYLHRKGMVKDTVHTTELDSVYAEGVQAIRDRDYERASALLGPYHDFNTAVAFLAGDRNMSALEILEPMERTGIVNYMLAVLYSRLGDEQKAVQCYVHACAQDRTYVSRGNLDPEISSLIKKYDLNKQDDDEFDLAI